MTVWELLETAENCVEAQETEGHSLPEAECNFFQTGEELACTEPGEETHRHTFWVPVASYLLLPDLQSSHRLLLSSWPIVTTSGVVLHS